MLIRNRECLCVIVITAVTERSSLVHTWTCEFLLSSVDLEEKSNGKITEQKEINSPCYTLLNKYPYTRIQFNENLFFCISELIWKLGSVHCVCYGIVHLKQRRLWEFLKEI